MKKITAASLLAAVALNLFAAPLPPDRVPAPLRPWIGWVMHGQEAAACPPAFNDANVKSCAWPGVLVLELSERGGSFRLRADAFAPETVLPLPGDAENWPQDVRVDGKAAAVLAIEGKPALRLPAGKYDISGTLPWKTLPPSLAVPAATGVLRVTLGGAPLAAVPDAQGRLWLNRGSEVRAEDALAVRTFRHFADGVPIRSSVRYELTVAGKPREVTLPAAVLTSWTPTAIDSPLPARIDAKGNATVQVRAGTWHVNIASSLMEPAQAIALPAAAEATAITAMTDEEIWSFQANNDVRVVSAQGLPSVDPKNVGVPPEWAGLPAFLAKPGSALKLVETRRGNAEGNADKITLARTYWLDFDGDGYTVQDRLTGTLGRTWRLELPPPFLLGRAAVNGVDQPITFVAKERGTGIELRDTALDLEADSRIESSSRTLLASGWKADVTGWSGALHLPPGWRLLHVAGADRVFGAWSANWTLWDLFFVAIIVAGAFRLFGGPLAVVLAVALILSWHDRQIPVFPWIGIVVAAALVGSLPDGRLRTWAARSRTVFAVIAAVFLVPYAITQVRQAMYPSLGFEGYPVTAQRAMPAAPAPLRRDALVQQRAEEERALADAPAEIDEFERKQEMLAGSVASSDRGKYAYEVPPGFASVAKSKRPYQQVDPNAKNLTGPGVPRWTAQTFSMSIQGPIAPDQTLHFLVLPPWANAVWGLLAIVTLGLALWRTAGISPADISARLKASLGRTAGVAVIALMLVGQADDSLAAKEAQPAPDAPIDQPSDARLAELRNRLTAPPTCMPACAELARLAISAKGDRIVLGIQVHAQAAVAFPLPGQGARARPASVTANAAPVPLRRDDNGTLWAQVREGVTEVALEINADDLAEVPIVLPVAPRQITHDLAGWTLAGLDARGLAAGSVQLVRRVQAQRQKANDAQRHDTLPPQVRIERTISLGQTWTTNTRVVRDNSSTLPVTVRVALLQGESVTDAAIKTENGEAVLELGQNSSANFAGSLKPGSQLTLKAARHAGQIEQWFLDASPQWHVAMKGIPPVSQKRGSEWLPSWMPWPGEEVQLAIDKPAAIDGATMTFDTVIVSSVIGKRTSDLSAEIGLRAGTGGNHAFTLPENAQLMRVLVDGVEQPLRAEGRKLTVPITPGAHRLKIEWRDAAGISARYAAPQLGLGGLPAVNAFVDLKVPHDRVVLMAYGPIMGPAVLLWGVLIVTLGLAVIASRTIDTPLRTVDWLLLGIGLVQSSIAATVVVAVWFLILAYRKRAPLIESPWRFNAFQAVLLLITLFAAGALFGVLKNGLLGYPDMLIRGNGSSAFLLRWYQDRIGDTTPLATFASIPVWAYRVLMLAWALWLALSLLKWIRWGWAAYSSGAYWKETPPVFKKREAAKTGEPATGGGVPPEAAPPLREPN